jgi:CubicO group peptidase (beta-lactamase class C family)
MLKALTLLLVMLAVVPSARAQDGSGCAPATLADGWTVARPGDVGMDGALLCEVDKLLGLWPDANIHALVVARRGKLVMERYWRGPDERWGTQIGTVAYGPTVKHDLRSISKSVTSLLVGIALGEGRFPTLDSPVIDQFPEHADLRTPDNARITLRHLLTMSSGFAWNEAIPYGNPANSERRLIAAGDPVRYVLEQPVVTPPGTAYNYNGGNTALLAAVLAKATGKRLDSYAREKLFGPLDITDLEWVDMPRSGEPAAASGLRLRPRDAAKLGVLLLADGAWNGRQVLPRGWAADSVRQRINGDGIYYYGYQWWVGRSLVDGREIKWNAGLGYGGQRLFVVPEHDLVAMVNAGHYTSPLQSVLPLAMLNRTVLPAVKD